MSNNIPYLFRAIPDEFLEDRFIEDIHMFRLIRYIFKRIRFCAHEEIFLVNRQQKKVQLKPLQFIYGREKSALECKTTPQISRNRINQLKNLGYIKKCTSSSTSTFTVYELSTDKFGKNTNQQLNQHLNQQFNHKEESNKEIQQQPNACVVSSTSKKTKKQALIDDILEKHSVDLDSAFLGSLIRRFSIKAISIAMDEYEKVKIKTNPRGLLTSIAKIHHEEMKENECKLANQ